MSTTKRFMVFLMTLSIGGFLSGCSEDGGGFNLFSLEDDKALGMQLSEEISNDPINYPIVDENQYPEAYTHIRRIRDAILNSGSVNHKDDFTWEVKLIHNDNVLNAFAAPGGYIYVYTGLIKFLEQEDHLAGVLGHEIAHADLRHSTDQLTTQYSISLLLDLLLGDNQGLLTEVAAGLLTLQFSRKHEAQADEYSVNYLCPTSYKADGAAGFFQKLLDLGNEQCVGEFLSTHPCPENRVQSIEDKRTSDGCTGTAINDILYQQFKNSLP